MIAALSTYDDDGTPTTAGVARVVVDAALTEADDLTDAWVKAWKNEHS